MCHTPTQPRRTWKQVETSGAGRMRHRRPTRRPSAEPTTGQMLAAAQAPPDSRRRTLSQHPAARWRMWAPAVTGVRCPTMGLQMKEPAQGTLGMQGGGL
eukprot:g24657.t1